jgi:hypothetical protein
MHKDTHTAVAVDCWTNKIGEITFANRLSAYDKFITDVNNSTETCSPYSVWRIPEALDGTLLPTFWGINTLSSM